MSQIIIPKTDCTDLTQEITRWLHTKFGPNPEYDSAKERDIREWGLPWFRAGALVVDEDYKILMIHEGRVHIKKVKDENYRQWLLETNRCDAGGWANGDGGWNIPAGRLTLGESFEEGVVREVKEETGHEVKVLSSETCQSSSQALGRLMVSRWRPHYRCQREFSPGGGITHSSQRYLVRQ